VGRATRARLADRSRRLSQQTHLSGGLDQAGPWLVSHATDKLRRCRQGPVPLPGSCSREDEAASMDVQGRVSLVTGAARRVGRAIALELAAAGCDVAVHFHTSAAPARDLAGRIKHLGRRVVLVQGDVADPETPARLVAETTRALGRLDVLVNNAATFQETPLDQNDPAVWNAVLRTNLLAPAMLSRAVAPLMRDAGAGRIVNVTDILADRPIRGYDAYCASKAALASLTRSLALELAPQITVNAIASAPVAGSPGPPGDPGGNRRRRSLSRHRRRFYHRPGHPPRRRAVDRLVAVCVELNGR